MRAVVVDVATAARATAGREHEFEARHGLPEALPPGEHILWQGEPDWRALAVQAFHLRQLAVYFAVLLMLRAGFALADGAGASAALRAVAGVAPLPLLALGLLAALAWLSARTTCYTLTNRRVVMRVGIVLTITFNLPLSRLTAADLRSGCRGSADIALTLAGRDRIAWLHLWPHVRPWRLARPQPALRCLPDGPQVAERLTRAWVAVHGSQVPSPAVCGPADRAPCVVGERPGERPVADGQGRPDVRRALGSTLGQTA